MPILSHLHHLFHTDTCHASLHVLRVRMVVVKGYGVPGTIPMAGSVAHAAAIRTSTRAHGPSSPSRQGKSRNTVVEQGYRAGNRGTRPMVGCPSCDAAPSTLRGLERRHRLRQGQREGKTVAGHTATAPCSALATSSPLRQGRLSPHRLHTKICHRALSIPPPTRIPC
jgi:hypothetical protein